MKILGTNDKSDLFLVLFFKLAHFLIPQVVDQFGYYDKELEEMLTSSRLATENLNSKLEEVHLQLKVKEDEIMHHLTNQEKMEKEKNDLQLCNVGLAEKLDMSL
ncbi:hypothetical protein JHK82_024919 [Glycine max]|nr:hypothetical protein JHK82_024919 [Glycine max]